MKKIFLSAGFVMMFGAGVSAMTNNSSYQFVNDTVVNDTVVTEETLAMKALVLAEDTVTEDSVILESLALAEDTVTEDSVILESLALAEDTVTEDSVILESLALAEDTVTRDTVLQEPVEQASYAMLAYAAPQAVAAVTTGMDYQSIEADALPQAVKDVIARDFIGSTIKEAYIEEASEVTYKVVLVDQAAKETTVVFNAEGQVKA